MGDGPPSQSSLRARRPVERVRQSLATTGLAVLAAIAVLRFHAPPRSLTPKPLRELFAAVPAADAYGRSGELRMHFVLPGGAVDFPLAVHGDPQQLVYGWEPVSDAGASEGPRPLAGGALVAPATPGFYRLVVERAGERREVPEVALAVMVPFREKRGASLDGYRIGTYAGERRARRGLPDGFVKVDARAADLPLSKHFRVGDFLSRDGQRQWPRFAAVQPRLIDKLELVITEVARMRGVHEDSVTVRVAVNAGFRSPSYNGTVARAAKDSRHQYGDAADVAIDADFDGRFTREDSRLVAAAVEQVERTHPDLVGGMGLYLSRKYAHSYVHIDARGTRARWRG